MYFGVNNALEKHKQKYGDDPFYAQSKIKIEITNAYQTTFLSTEQGRLVLLDLISKFSNLDTNPSQSHAEMSFQLGSKLVLDKILHVLNIDVTDLIREMEATSFLETGDQIYDDPTDDE